MKVKIYYFRSLFSQSACSLSAGKFSSFLLDRGYNTDLALLKMEDYAFNHSALNDINNFDIIVYKANYKDFEYGIRLFENLIQKDTKFYVTGAFALLNEKAIIKKFPFITKVINIQNCDEVEKFFPIIGEKIEKNSVICGCDRQIDMLEKGRYINLEASTGCIYRCAFCHINLIGYPFKNIEIENVVEEISNLITKLNKKYFIFNDSIFWKGDRDNERIEKFISLVKEKNLKFYFYIYLALKPTISEELLIKLKEIGLIRVFVGVENITDDFQEHNPKAVNLTSAEQFLQMLRRNKVSYHIGFMMFFPDVKYENLFVNLKYLHSINKLFRLGIIVEKMRILPRSTNSNILYKTEGKIDQCYNYHFVNEKVKECYDLVKNYFNNVNMRYFEQFFTGIDIIRTILNREGLEKEFENELLSYDNLVTECNDKLFLALNDIFTNLVVTPEHITTLCNIYAKAEINYTNFINKLKVKHEDIFKCIPHGKEELNIW